MIPFFGLPPALLAGYMAGAVGLILLGLLVLALFNRVLLKMALRNIPRRRAQTVLILFGLMLATLIITASLGVGDTLSYSLQAIQLKQIGGVDEAFTRHPDQSVQGAGTSGSDFFTAAQAADVISRSKLDPNVAVAMGVLVAPGSLTDETTHQVSSQNLAVFGVPAAFNSVWGTLLNRSGNPLDAASLGLGEVYLGTMLADRLNASRGDRIHIFVDGKPTDVVVRDILQVEVNPSIAGHGPIVNSVLMPLASLRTLMARPTEFNLILLHNQGGAGLAGLGPGGATGDEITRRLRAEFTDTQAAADLRALASAPDVREQIRVIRDGASFLDPTGPMAARVLAALDPAAPADDFKALAEDGFVQGIISNALNKAIAKDSSSASAGRAAELPLLLASLHVDTGAAADLRALLTTRAIRAPIDATIAALPAADPGRALVRDLLKDADQSTLTPAFKALASTPALQRELVAIVAAGAPAQAAHFKSAVDRLDLYEFQPYKADAVRGAQTAGLVVTGALLGVSFFSIAVGVLLIFLIFVMLAAERRAEMGMSRAVGLKRRHLTQMFLYEGVAYTLVASLVGVVFGVLVGALMIRVLSGIFSGFYSGIALEYHLEWPSLVESICLGILLTFVVVAFSAYRVSRLNIVAAIRDLDETEARDGGMAILFMGVFKVAGAGFRQLGSGHPLVFLNRVLFGTAGAMRSFWWALFRRGPLTAGLGLLLAWRGSSTHSELVYSAGVALLVIGCGLLVRWILTLFQVRPAIASRIGFTLAAVGLLVYFGRIFGRVEKQLHFDGPVQLDKLIGGPEMFALTALMVLLGAIWLVMYNSDVLIRVVMFFTGRIGRLAPITRTSMAYPMSTKFRTGMTVAMFAIVTFMIVYMSVFKDVLIQNYGQVDAESGGWQVVAGTPDQNFQATADTSFPADVAARVRSDPRTAADVKAVGWENQSVGVELRQVHSDGSLGIAPSGRGAFKALHVVDEGYLNGTGYALHPRAAGYTSDVAAWNAVRDNTGYAVLDTTVLDAQGSAAALVSGIKSSDDTFQPFQVQVTSGSDTAAGTPRKWTLTVVGFLVRPVWNGVYVSIPTARDSGLFSDQPVAGSESTGLNSLRPLTPTGYYFTLKPGVDVRRGRLDLGRLLVADRLEPVVVADQLAAGLSTILTLLNLITGFLALGLIVGIAGLGVISTRAVVERWQQIGMLRAIGYRKAMVQRSFLMESSLISLLGLVIGAIVGVWESYRFFVSDKTFGSVDFHVPLVEIALILAGAYLATMLTTFMPARAAAQVAPAEALRYE